MKSDWVLQKLKIYLIKTQDSSFRYVQNINLKIMVPKIDTNVKKVRITSVTS